MTRSAPSRARGRRLRRAQRGFSLMEMLFATTISSMLFTSLLLSLDAMFKGYEQTTDTASTQVVTRIAINRVLGLIRTGSDFAPIPADVLDAGLNPHSAHWFEFVSRRDADGAIEQVTRLEFRFQGEDTVMDTWSPEDEPPSAPEDATEPGTLYMTFIDVATGNEVERVLLTGVRQAIFTLHFEIGPQLQRATIDLTVEPDIQNDLAVATDAVPQTIRVVASAMPRRAFE